MTQVDCPEGHIKLPIDLWHCKITRTACPIQAQIDTESWAKFHRHCLAGTERQHGIKAAITSGEYNGFHHMFEMKTVPST